MGDSTISNPVGAAATQVNDASHQLLASATPDNNMNLLTKAGRVGEVTVEGLLQTPAGAWNALVDAAKPANWGKDAEMVASAAVFGLAMRTCLPETGMIAKSAGLIMGGMFAMDGLKNVGTAWSTVTKDGSDQAMHSAATQMGNGLGAFALDGAVSMWAGGLGAKKAPDLWNKVAPDQWNALESWKARNLADTTPIGSTLGKVGLGFHSKVSSLADAIDPPKPSVADLNPDVVRESIAASGRSNIANVNSESFYKYGARGSNGMPHGLSETVQLLLDGKDPRTVPAGIADATSTTPFAQADLTHPSMRIADSTSADAAGTAGASDLADGQGDAQHVRKPTSRKPKPTDTADGADSTTAATAAAPQTEAQRILNLKTMSAQAAVTRAVLASVSDQQGMVMDAINRTTGAVDVRTNPNAKPLDGYDEPREAMLSLAQQVGADPRGYMQVGDLFNRFADASVQSGTRGISDVGDHIARFNLYAKENLTTYERNILQQGIDPKVALQRKVVAPLGEATSDLEPIGVDGDGNPQYAHEGPHTVRAIYGPNGEPIWPIDLIKSPVRELGMRGTQTSGIYGHELMHDQFGRLGEFDPEARDAKLGEAAAKALGADANKTIDLPNGGVDPQQVLINNIERQAGKLTDPAERDQFLTESLQLDPQSKVMKAGAAADQLLGQAGQQQVVKLQQGQVPLDVFIANLAAQADTRAPEAVLAELKGQGNPQQTDALISQNLDKMLGQNGQMPIRLADGTRSTLKDTVLKVSEMSRNPEFKTYGEPLPQTMTMQNVLVNVAKAWADETFADWGAAAESGQSAAPYFQALRKDGRLAGGTVMGQEMRSESNPLGIEAHPVDKLRPRYQAALIRELATANGQSDQTLLDWADALDKYSRDAGQTGDIKLASMDAPGQAITIPEKAMDTYIQELAKQQLHTPLPRLQGKTLFDILPDLRKNFRINDDLSTQWSDAIQKGQKPDSLPFDTNTTKMTHVYGAGQLTFLKLVADGMDPMQANDAVNAYSDFFGNKFLEDGDPHAQTPFATRLKLAPRQTLAAVPQYFAAPTASVLRSTPAATSFLGRNANAIGAGSASYLVNDLFGMHQAQPDVSSVGQ